MPSRVFVDTETTGLGPTAEIIEIGYVKVVETPSGIVSTRERAYRLRHNRLHVSEGAHKVNDLGTGGRDPIGLLLPEDELVETLSEDWRGCELVFNNPAFDIHLIRKLFDRQHAEPTWRYHPVDVKMLLIGAALADPAGPKNAWYPDGIEPEPAIHNALDGARLVERQFEAYARLASR